MYQTPLFAQNVSSRPFLLCDELYDFVVDQSARIYFGLHSYHLNKKFPFMVMVELCCWLYGMPTMIGNVLYAIAAQVKSL